MNRRRFLGSSVGAATLIAELPNVAAQKNQASQRRRLRVTDKLAGKSLPQLRDQYRSRALQRLSALHGKVCDRRAIGGFMCNVDHHGRQVNQNKLSWFEGRGIWVYRFSTTILPENRNT